ncbi:nicotinate-nucleotide adenylyltransferase [Ignavigranum ruoffiae]|uniref:Probable nicotinate-nucleotide adenylyltransferase n=1 Tax=Ignavigranum ruoffiae TaxID=89093 RepID=A0A1H9FXP0_9LACT|nr:nicotinate-nucleotide adenylyltransferase [Ignavigranum ruoffiae]
MRTRETLYLKVEEEIDLVLEELVQAPQSHHRQRIGILGGTFNPPHLGHLLMAEQVGKQLELDEVWFMPTAKPPHAPGKQTIAANHRLEMVKLAIQDNPLFKLQAYEVYKGGTNYSVDTMQHFVQAFPEADFYFIVGEDSVRDLPTWHRVEELSQLVQFVGIRRPGTENFNSIFPVIWVDSPLIDLSSTEIRLRVYLEQSIRYQVPPAVEAYIIQHQLYAMEV